MLLDIEKIRIACARKKASLTEIIKKAHVSTLSAQRMRKGQNVTTKTAGKLAEALGVDVTEIMTSN